MTDLKYQTFKELTRVFIGADAMITARADAGNFPHDIVVKDCHDQHMLTLHLTSEAAIDLRDLLSQAIMVAGRPAERPFTRTPGMVGPDWAAIAAASADAGTLVVT